MGKIQVLDSQLANQIAAGEVVERPASVVKELLENSIDAKATKIVVTIVDGGTSSIRVSDNGLGMDREDAVLAFSRHATSKIRYSRDLFAIRSLGFRGEALPSIASVAEVSLTTSATSGLAIRVQMAGGDLVNISECSRGQGTDVHVDRLFYNTPARLKYLKMVTTEVSHVADVVGRMALAHPAISFTLLHNKKELFRTPGDGKLLHVMHALYGKQVARQLTPIEAEDLDFRIYGLIAKPEVTRASRSYITWILNGRFVRSLPLTQTLLRAYDTLLPIGRYPIAALHLEMDPKLVDVNVHPSKLEIRLSKEKECCRLVQDVIRQAFAKETLIPKVNIQRSTPHRTEQQSFDHLRSTNQEKGSWIVREPQVKQPPIQNSQETSKENNKRSVERPELDTSSVDQPKALDKKDHKELAQVLEQVVVEALDEIPQEQPQSPFPIMNPLTQIHGTYIVAQSDDGFYLLDQHAAHERIYYEVFSKRFDQVSRKQQLLLIPLSLELSPANAQLLLRHLQDFQKWGIEVEHFGGNTFLVRSYPIDFPSDELEPLIHELLEWLQDQRDIDWSRLRDTSAKMMACKAAIKANRHLKREEMEALLQDLAMCDQPFTCPHGRPIFVHFSSYDLKKMFKRVM
ncbi:DNA mismatch repair protein MutL [Seinonella peptonophila]|uniref:DNA mismatch repair protein MutL n=1 Tax=Seinonella peptonophila TaxID=112248 RepID=A0A1M4T290_9BACL|nr:DNA mismatch repair endonuclease MutL [Seinonella peptonophila]SHE38525.1 DNA mismatch repair protein MutL [Seinonella peptonophila]